MQPWMQASINHILS